MLTKGQQTHVLREPTIETVYQLTELLGSTEPVLQFFNDHRLSIPVDGLSRTGVGLIRRYSYLLNYLDYGGIPDNLLHILLTFEPGSSDLGLQNFSYDTLEWYVRVLNSGSNGLHYYFDRVMIVVELVVLRSLGTDKRDWGKFSIQSLDERIQQGDSHDSDYDYIYINERILGLRNELQVIDYPYRGELLVLMDEYYEHKLNGGMTNGSSRN